MSTKLYVGNLPFDVTEADLRTLLSEHGPVEEIAVVMDKVTGKARGFAFATMNTQVFHANGDLETNKWASEKMGTAMKTVVNVSVSSQPKHSSKPRHWFFDAFKPDDERESTSSASLNQHREAIFQPEAFAQLKKGGDGSCQAVVLWVSHQFNCNEGRPFRVTVFQQDDNQP